MSAGKHLVDYGFIGVSPSGPIVEASSSPLQTIIYAISYALFGVGYETFSSIQTGIASFFLGSVFIGFFESRRKGILFSIASALVLTTVYPFFFWHGSGMENALTHVFLLATVYLLYRANSVQKVNYYAVPIVFLATVVRVDSVYFVAPLLVLFSASWKVQYKSWSGLTFSLLVFLCWSGANLGRYYYFGDFLPNTAYAQNISVSKNLSAVAHADFTYLKKAFRLAQNIILGDGGWLLLLIAPMVVQLKVARRQHYSRTFLFHSLVLMLALGFLAPFLFGRARIDPARTTSQLALFVVVLIGVSLSYIDTKEAKKGLAYGIPLALFFGLGAFKEPYYLGYSTKMFNARREKFKEIALKNRIDRATISNPDLGVMTWYKEFNEVDLGKLGSPTMAKLSGKPKLTEYYLDFMLPDIIEAHSVWVRKHCAEIFSQPDFHHRYQMLDKSIDIRQVCKSRKKPKLYFWIRKDLLANSKSHERKLLDELQASLTLSTIKSEIASCKARGEECTYIARTLFKFIPELRAKGLYWAVLRQISNEKERALLSGWRDAQAHQAFLH